ncbi:MAG: tetratricopeptide repeat protein [Kiritimatiellae bacterium]|nr:tetratricopeptide repeat protein [Kiritimatiellia bacterium]
MKKLCPRWLSGAAAMAVAAVVASAGLCGCGEPTAEELVKQGVEDLRRGAVSTGVESLEKAVALGGPAVERTQGAEVWNWIGLARWALGDREGAKAAFQTSIEAVPGGFAANYNLGMLWLEEGRMEEGIPLLKTAKDLDPSDVLSLLAIGDYTTRQGRLDLAKRMYEAAKKRDARNPAVLTGLGRVALLGGEKAQAETYFMEALEMDKGYGPALYDLGVLHSLEEGSGEEAAEYFRRYLEAEPGGVRAEVAAERLGGKVVEQVSFRTAGGGEGGGGVNVSGAAGGARKESMVDLWKRAKERKAEGDTAGAAELAARAVELAGEDAGSEVSMEVVRRALAEYPAAAGVQVAAGMFWEKKGNLAGAQEAYRKAQKLEPQNSTALESLARVATAREEYDTAVMALRQLLAAEPKNANALWALADLYGDKLGMTGKGMATYREFERECSTDPRAQEVEEKIRSLEAAEAELPPLEAE